MCVGGGGRLMDRHRGACGMMGGAVGGVWAGLWAGLRAGQAVGGGRGIKAEARAGPSAELS